MPEELALDLLSRPDEIRREMAARLAQLPFNWKGRIYRIARCEVSGDDVVVEVVPPDPALVDEVKRRVEASRHKVLMYCQLYGFICFPEDYEKYKNC